MQQDPPTRILHLLVAAGVASQMVASLGMVHPKPDRLPNGWCPSTGYGWLRSLTRGETMAPLMWAYLVAYPLPGLVHQFAGHRTLNRIFSLG